MKVFARRRGHKIALFRLRIPNIFPLERLRERQKLDEKKYLLNVQCSVRAHHRRAGKETYYRIPIWANKTCENYAHKDRRNSQSVFVYVILIRISVLVRELIHFETFFISESETNCHPHVVPNEANEWVKKQHSVNRFRMFAITHFKITLSSNSKSGEKYSGCKSMKWKSVSTRWNRDIRNKSLIWKYFFTCVFVRRQRTPHTCLRND